METQTLQAEVRHKSGKGPARQLRTSGLIPAVLYGPGGETEMLSVSPKDLLKAVATAHGRNTVLSLTTGGKSQLAMVRDVEVHPVSREPLHVDFLRVSVDREILVNVPFGTTGKAAGVGKGGKLKVVRRAVPVRTTPDKIPTLIDVDVTPLEMGDTLPVKSVPVPAGVTIVLSPELTLVVIEGEQKELPEEAAPGAAAAPAAAAPAAAGKKAPEKK